MSTAILHGSKLVLVVSTRPDDVISEGGVNLYCLCRSSDEVKVLWLDTALIKAFLGHSVMPIEECGSPVV